MASKWSIASEDSILSIASRNSALSIGSVGSILSIGSIGSAVSAFSIGSATKEQPSRPLESLWRRVWPAALGVVVAPATACGLVPPLLLGHACTCG